MPRLARLGVQPPRAPRRGQADRAGDAAGEATAFGELEREAARVLAAWQEMTGPEHAAASAKDGGA